MPRVDAPASAAAAVALAAGAWTVGCGVLPAAATMPPVLVPALFVLAGALGPVWRAERFTCRLLVAVGALHLVALAASAALRLLPAAAPEWHLASLLLYVAGFAALLPLAAGYPTGPAPRAAWIAAAVVLVLPVAASFAGRTPAVLQGEGATLLVRPIAPLLPVWSSSAAASVFLVPLVAVGIGAIRAVRGGRELRGRLVLPLTALAVFAVLLAAGALLPAPEVETALFLVASPLVPCGLVLGARRLLVPVESPFRQEALLTALSPREREVLAAMADGRTNAAIAQQLHMSLSAVEKHTTAIFTKLGLPPAATTHRRVAAVVAYLRAAAR